MTINWKTEEAAHRLLVCIIASNEKVRDAVLPGRMRVANDTSINRSTPTVLPSSMATERPTMPSRSKCAA